MARPTKRLEYLKQIPDMGFLNIINVPLDNTALKTLGQLTQLYGVKLLWHRRDRR